MARRANGLLPCLICLSAFGLAGCAGTSRALGPIARLLPETTIEESLLREVNAARRQEGLAPLVLEDALIRIARAHTWDMARMRRISHQGRDRMTVEGRADRMEIDWLIIGENVARNRGYDDPVAKAVADWLKSQNHRANIMNPEFVETGIGVVRGRDGYIYFTQVFMKP
ncbi:MAG: CAP domain-containing protein, partial [Planctomycetota bacterium]